MNLHFRNLGAGPPLIILHGLFGSSDNWMTLARQLATRFQVFLPDLRNHGRSPHAETFDIPTLAADLLELIASEKIVRPSLIGHSLGGKVAMHLSLAHADLIDRLIVVDISPAAKAAQAFSEFYEIVAAMRAMDLTGISSRQEADAGLSPRIPDPDVRQFLLKNLQRRSDHGFAWRLNLEGIARNLEEVGAGIETNRPYPKPVLFIRGEFSPYIGRDDEVEIMKMFPGAEITTIPGAGHWVHAEAPAAVLRSIVDFLSRPPAL